MPLTTRKLCARFARRQGSIRNVPWRTGGRHWRFRRTSTTPPSVRTDGGVVDVRRKRQCLPPVRHGTLRIEPCRLAKRAQSFRVVKGIDQSQALVDKALRAGRLGGHSEMKLTQVL